MAPSGTQFDQFRTKLALNHRILLESLQIFSICQLGAIYRHTDDLGILHFLHFLQFLHWHPAPSNGTYTLLTFSQLQNLPHTHFPYSWPDLFVHPSTFYIQKLHCYFSSYMSTFSLAVRSEPLSVWCQVSRVTKWNKCQTICKQFKITPFTPCFRRPARPRVAEIFQDCGRINHIKSKYFYILIKTNYVVS